MPLGLLQELHSWHTLVRIPIFWPDETKDGHRPWVSCCPFCTYTIQNDPAYLNHILSACITMRALHLWGMPRCRSHVRSTAEEAPFRVLWADHSFQDIITGKYVHSEHSPKKSAHGSSSFKSKHAGSKNKKSHHPGKSQPVDATSQEDSQTGDRHLTHVASA